MSTPAWSRDHTVLYCTIVLYSTKKEKICLQTHKEQADVSKTESTLILSGSSPDTRGSWPIDERGGRGFGQCPS